MEAEQVDLSDIQGNILRGYRADVVRHIMVKVDNRGAAKQFLSDAISRDLAKAPQITTAEEWDADGKPTTFLNVGVTAAGLRALGLSETSVQSFPREFLEGPVVRADKIGDVDESAPTHWQDGFGQPDGIHLMWSIHAQTPGQATELGVDAQTSGRASELRADAQTSGQAAELLHATCQKLEAMWVNSGAFEVVSRRDGAALPGDQVHFGYRDSISQPRFEFTSQTATDSSLQPTRVGKRDGQPTAPLGAVLLGYKTTFPDVKWQMPTPRELGVNGCFNAFRVLEQDVVAFEAFLRSVVAKHGGEARPFVTEEYVAAKLMGRWRNGVPLALWPDSSDATTPTNPTFLRSNVEDDLNAFDYPDVDPNWDDYEGLHCPLGAHIRRANPRGAQIVQRSANNTRRLVRRGIPYGPRYNPKEIPDAAEDGVARGLLGNFLCASLIAQFESIMYDWINLGLQDPRITGTNDAILGANKVSASRFEIPLKDEDPMVLTGFPRFIKTVGSAYFFCPSITALRLLANS